MSEVIGGRVVLDLAIQAEEKGTELYKTLSRNSKNFHVSRIFKELAEDEEKHLEELRKWEKRVAPYQPPEAYPGEYILYIKAMADENTFKCDNACKRFLEIDLSETDALQAGITFEKDFIIFLHTLKKHVSKDGYKIVDKIIESEESHLKKLYALKKQIDHDQ